MFRLVNSFVRTPADLSIAQLVLRRIAMMLPTLWCVTLLLCAIAHFAPGRPTTGDDSSTLSSQQAASLSAWNEASFGYDQPYWRRYVMWMERVFVPVVGEGMFPMGRSMLTGRSVRAELQARLPVTMALSALSLLLAASVALPAGAWMALRAGRLLDRTLNGALLTVWSVPMVVMATLLLGFTARGGLGVQWFPSGGVGSGVGESWSFATMADFLWHLALPATCLAIVACAPLAKLVRAAMLEQLGQDYVQTALAKGLPRRRVIRQHVVRASAAPVLTKLLTLIPGVLAGSVLIETMFSIDGMGMLAWRSAINRDFDVVLMIAMITAAAHMLALLAGDVMYAWLDPRVRMRGKVGR